MKTIRDLIDYSMSVNKPFIVQASHVTMLPFMNDYINLEGLSLAVDTNFSDERGFFNPIYDQRDGETDEQYFNRFQRSMFSLLFKNKEKYTRLYEVTKLQYKPIENYAMTEEGSDSTVTTGHNVTTHGEIEKTDNIGAVTVTSAHGARENSLEYGERTKNINIGEGTKELAYGAESITENIGAISVTDNIGNRSDSETDGVAGYNSSQYSNSTKKDMLTGEQTNTHNEQGRVNTTGKEARTDTERETARVNSESENTHTDTERMSQFTDSESTNARTDSSRTTQSPTEEDVSNDVKFQHKLTRSGNIGVTTSQQMAQSEIDLWSAFDFYGTIIEDIVENLCVFYDDGMDTFRTPLWNEMF